MKAYSKYMDNVSVSDTLHQRIMSYADISRAKRHSIIVKRYAIAVACLVVVLLGVFIMPKLMQYNIIPTSDDGFAVLQPDSRMPTPSVLEKYSLYFNRAEGQAEAKIYIPGHYWEELTANEIKSLFPMLSNTHTVQGAANFQSDENGTALFNINLNAESASGLESYIQIAPGEIALDYVFDTETKSSDVLGTAVTAGYFETGPNKVGIRNSIYFAAFKLSEIAYYVELNGAEAEKEALKQEIIELVGLLIEGGAANIDIFHPFMPEVRVDRMSLDEARSDH